MKQLTIKIDDDLLMQLEHLSIDLDMSIDDYIIALIDNDLKKRKEKLMDDIVSENREAFTELAK